MRIRTLATVTAAVAAAAIGFAPAASADTSTTYPWTLSYQTASASGTGVSSTTIDSAGYRVAQLVVTGTLTNTGSGCYEAVVDNYLGGFGHDLIVVGGVCGPGTKAINYTVNPEFQANISLCTAASLTSTPCATWGPTRVSFY
ncbi:hypothetical protein ACFYNO_34220 [Kitasatospora sp. NPDC006697]|uniref:hypothetical protein n=1 Tax=Kitasatospora sp. NPDC006697 TaxID=3364020 RepID=UPI0036D04855